MKDQVKGDFTITNNMLLLTQASRLLAYQITDQTILVLTNAREKFTTPQQHADFDALLYARENSASLMYVDDIRKFIDPKARLADALAGTFDPAIFGIELTPEEAALAATYKSLGEKLQAKLTLPKVPYNAATSVDIEKVFGNKAEAAVKWLSTGERDYDLEHFAGREPNTRNLLRVSGEKVKTIRTLTGYSISLNNFKRAIPIYLKRVEAESWGGFESITVAQYERKKFRIYKDHVEIGCQSIPRGEIDRIIDELNLRP